MHIQDSDTQRNLSTVTALYSPCNAAGLTHWSSYSHNFFARDR